MTSSDRLIRRRQAATNTLKSRHSGNFTARLLASSMADPDEFDESEEEGAEELELW